MSTRAKRDFAKRDFDVLIVGGGLVGACLAGLLAADHRLSGLRIGLIEAQPPQPHLPADGEIDLRVSAIAQGSRRLLKRTGAWALVPTARVCPYEEMIVWDSAGAAQGSGSIHFRAAEIGAADLGCIVENRALSWALHAAPTLRERVTLLRATLTGLSLDGEGGHATVTLSDGRRLTTHLVIAADGAGSPTRSLAGITVRSHPYEQTAVVTHVHTALPHSRAAYQRFLPEGPLAFLPLTDGRSSIVWTTTRDHAARLLELDAGTFGKELELASDGILGSVTLAAPRASFPLQRMHATEYTRPGLVLVGDAAHAVHPLAGQGVNLGFADAGVLAATLADAVASGGGGWADRRVLRRYERARKSENGLAIGVIDGLNRLFAAADPLSGALRRSGLGWLNRSQLAKRMLVRRAMGLESNSTMPE